MTHHILKPDAERSISEELIGLCYAIANASAFTLPAGQRRLPRWLPASGLVGCLLLAATLPWLSVVTGLAVFAAGLVGRALVLARRRA
ncbi:hypothetical protein [Amycolatopsis anabasis]|uniref:hypothetical protein n=1 Tax=Amycolatopsis anabasis TaxID=1840409 RepID=UPI001C553A06|nr:hypothetical protein [Amycolatopsis anabasis]